MIIAWYYIGMLLGLAVVLFCNFIARRASGVKRGSMCDRCKHMPFKDWKGQYWCDGHGYHYFTPKHCALYKEREDTND